MMLTPPSAEAASAMFFPVTVPPGANGQVILGGVSLPAARAQSEPGRAAASAGTKQTHCPLSAAAPATL